MPRALATIKWFATLDFTMKCSARVSLPQDSLLVVNFLVPGNGILGKLTQILGAKMQLSLSLDILLVRIYGC